VQVDGARLEIYGDFEAQRQPPSPSNTGYAVLATAKQDRFQDTPTRESRQRPAKGNVVPLRAQGLSAVNCVQYLSVNCAKRSRREKASCASVSPNVVATPCAASSLQ